MLIAAIPAEFGDEEEAQALIDPRIGTRARRRRRQFVSKMFSEHGPIYTLRLENRVSGFRVWGCSNWSPNLEFASPVKYTV